MAGGSSIDPDTAASVDCTCPSAAPGYERPLRATHSVGVVEPLSSEFPTSRASEFGGCSAAEHPCLFDAAFKFTATQHSGPGRPKAGRHIHNWSYDFQITCSS